MSLARDQKARSPVAHRHSALASLAVLLLTTLTIAPAVRASSPAIAAPSPTAPQAPSDEAEPLAAGVGPFAFWGCHGPTAIGMLTGGAIGGATFGIIGALGTYNVNAGVGEEQRTTLTGLSFMLSAALGVVVGGGVGAAIGLLIEAIVPDEPVRRVIRVSETAEPAPAGAVAVAY